MCSIEYASNRLLKLLWLNRYPGINLIGNPLSARNPGVSLHRFEIPPPSAVRGCLVVFLETLCWRLEKLLPLSWWRIHLGCQWRIERPAWARGLVWNGDSLEDRSDNEEYPKEDQKWMMTRLLALVLQHSSVLHPVPILFYVGTSIMFFISSLVIVVTEIFYYCNLQVRPLNLKLAWE